jgi:hypothetical protein
MLEGDTAVPCRMVAMGGTDRRFDAMVIILIELKDLRAG